MTLRDLAIDADMMIYAVIPIRTVSALNVREHWRKRAQRVKKEREAVALILRPLIRAVTKHYAITPACATLERVAPRPLDFDNLCGSLKGIQDQVAAELGVDDRSPRVTWQHEQSKGKPKEYAVRITIRPRSE